MVEFLHFALVSLYIENTFGYRITELPTRTTSFAKANESLLKCNTRKLLTHLPCGYIYAISRFQQKPICQTTINWKRQNVVVKWIIASIRGLEITTAEYTTDCNDSTSKHAVISINIYLNHTHDSPCEVLLMFSSFHTEINCTFTAAVKIQTFPLITQEYLVSMKHGLILIVF
jgi:hypothetical protein